MYNDQTAKYSKVSDLATGDGYVYYTKTKYGEDYLSLYMSSIESSGFEKKVYKEGAFEEMYADVVKASDRLDNVLTTISKSSSMGNYWEYIDKFPSTLTVSGMEASILLDSVETMILASSSVEVYGAVNTPQITAGMVYENTRIVKEVMFYLKTKIESLELKVEELQEQIQTGVIKPEGDDDMSDYVNELTEIKTALGALKSSNESILTSLEDKLSTLPDRFVGLSTQLEAVKATTAATLTTELFDVKINDLKTLVEGMVSSEGDGEITATLQEIKDAIELIEIPEKIDYTTVLVELKQLVKAIPTIDQTEALSAIKGLIEGIEMPESDVDNTEAIAAIKTVVDAIPTTNYNNTLSEIKSSIEGISIPEGGVDNTELIESIKTAVDKIPTANYNNSLVEIKALIEGIEIPEGGVDNTVAIDAIKTAVDSIPKVNYNNTLAEIKGLIEDIEIPAPIDNTVAINAIKTAVDKIPVINYTESIEEIKLLIEDIAIPAPIDNTAAINAIKTVVDNIPVTNYNSKLTELQNSVTALQSTVDGMVGSLATIVSNTTPVE